MEHKRGRIATTAHLTPRDVPPGWGGILCAFVFVVKKYPLLNQCAVDCRLKWRDFFTAAQKSCALHVLVKTIASKSWPYYVHHNLTKIVISIDGGSVVLLWVHFGPIVFLKEVVKNSLRGTSLHICDRWSAFEPGCHYIAAIPARNIVICTVHLLLLFQSAILYCFLSFVHFSRHVFVYFQE